MKFFSTFVLFLLLVAMQASDYKSDFSSGMADWDPTYNPYAANCAPYWKIENKKLIIKAAGVNENAAIHLKSPKFKNFVLEVDLVFDINNLAIVMFRENGIYQWSGLYLNAPSRQLWFFEMDSKRNIAGICSDRASFDYQTGKVYRLKLEAAGSACRAKIWDKDGTEPDKWTLSCIGAKIMDEGYVDFCADRGTTPGSFNLSFGNLLIKEMDTKDIPTLETNDSVPKKKSNLRELPSGEKIKICPDGGMTVKPHGEETVAFKLPETAGREFYLEFKARLQSDSRAGYGNYLELFINGQPIDIKYLENKPSTCVTYGASPSPTIDKNNLLVFFTPSFNPMPDKHSYAPKDPDYDPFFFRINITSLVDEGENSISLKNTLAPQYKSNLVMEDAVVRIIPSVKAVIKRMDNFEIDNREKFVLGKSKTLNVNFAGQALIVKDSINGVESLEEAEQPQLIKTSDHAVLNVIKKDSDKVNYRREACLSKKGLELSIKTDYKPYNIPAGSYTFSVPLELLKNAEYKAVVGVSYDNEIIEGKVSDLRQGSSIINPAKKSHKETRVRYIAFKSPILNLVFDINPYGATQLYTDYVFSGEPIAVCSVSKSADTLDFTFFSRAHGNNGGLYSAKVLIYEGEWDFLEKHPYQMWKYTGGPEPLAKYAFGTKIPKCFKKGGLTVFDSKKKFGWDDIAGLKEEETDRENIFKNSISLSSGERSFFIKAHPGCYVITLSCGDAVKALGPFDVFMGDKPVANNITIPAGKNKIISGSQYVREQDPRIKITLKGSNWAINTAVAQVFIYQNEDYVINRKYWVADGLYEPDISINNQKQATTAPVKLPGGRTWNYKMRMVSWVGTGHNATGFEYNTPELVAKRVAELRKQGYNTINTSQYFWNLGFIHNWDKTIEMIKMLTAAAHKEGMAVVYHIDGAVPVYMGSSLDYLMKHPDFLQRDVIYNIPTLTRMCLNNPDFRKEFFTRLIQLARESMLDGFMIDECSFAARQYCGCEYCRGKFEKETGTVMPLDPGSPVFFNFSATVWTKWIRWRSRSVGNWWIDMRKALDEANPDITLMLYTTEYGLYGSWANVEFGADMENNSIGIDFIGTECMPRNVFDAYRFENVFRKINRGLGDSVGKGVWGLVYHQNDRNIAYAGWALHHLNGQSCWMSMIEGDNMLRYLEWQRQMDFTAARQQSDIAILFSTSTRDFLKSQSYPDFAFEMMGFSQIMTDNHLLHDFILERDLVLEKLKKYKLVILPGTSCMSKAQCEVLKAYVADGGRILVTGEASIQDENGTMRANFELADVMGLNYDGGDINGPANFIFKDGGRKFTYSKDCVKTVRRDGSELTLLATVGTGEKTEGLPGFTVNKYKSGLCYYSACKPGDVNAELEHSAGNKWTFSKNQEMADYLTSIVRTAAGDTLNVLTPDLPEKVLVNVFAQKNKDGDFLIVHLLNMQGAAVLKPGDTVPSKKIGDVFPAMKKDIIIDIRLGNIYDGFAVSPDYEGEKSVDVKKMDNGFSRVTVKKEDLKTYTLVYLKKK